MAENERLGVTIVVRPSPGSPPLPTLDDWQAIPLKHRTYLTLDDYARREVLSSLGVRW